MQTKHCNKLQHASYGNSHHQHFMSLALELAARGSYTVSPNPQVGCVIVNEQNQIIGQGYHHHAGGPHAEIVALQEAQQYLAHDATHHATHHATAYVTLEPCAHFGRTPPCTDALIAAGIKKIYVACKDPNPLVSGRGIEQLTAHGIEVEVGLCEAEARKQNEIFFHYIVHKTPFVYAKWAMSLDGKTITHIDDDRNISGAAAAQFTHQLRASVDAIMVGSCTARLDNPQLTVRLQQQVQQQLHQQQLQHPLRQPLRIVLATDINQLPPNLQIFSQQSDCNNCKTLIATTTSWKNLPSPFSNQDHIQVLMLPKNSQGRVDLHALLKELGKREITSVLVEGGMTLHESLMQDNLINKQFTYVSPTLIGQLDKKRHVKIVQLLQLNNEYIYEVEHV